MVAGKTTRLKEHVIAPRNYNDFKRVKSAIVYGANAAGKSNLIRAIDFMRRLVLVGTKTESRINIKKFELLSNNNKPSRFEIEISINNNNYAYGFLLSDKYVHEEWLYRVNKKSEEEIFVRTVAQDGVQKFSYAGMPFTENDREQELTFSNMAKLCPSNQLLLTEYVNSRKRLRTYVQDKFVQPLEDMFLWFSEKLQIIFPNSAYMGSPNKIPGVKDGAFLISELLNCFDTGIRRIKLSDVSLDKVRNIFPSEVLDEIHADLKDGEEGVLLESGSNDRFIISRNDNKIIYQKICAEHETPDGSEVAIDFSDESDGTKRLFDLLPAYLGLFHKSESVLIIDEIDRSLHSQIAIALLKCFLESDRCKKSQFIITTHETSLLDQELIRKDEVWFVDKKRGQSSVYSLEEFLPRYDKDIRSAYMKGRFGATPVIYKNPNAVCSMIG
jgi:hypothetical protein